jgi:hypothetical protein
MPDLASKANMLGALLEETRGVVGVALGTAGGQLRAVVGSVVDGEASAAVAAALTAELGKVGSLLGLGELGVASLKAATAARVFARQAGAAVVIELDPKRPLGELEAKLQTVAWAPHSEVLEPPVGRMPPRVAERPDSPPAPAAGPARAPAAATRPAAPARTAPTPSQDSGLTRLMPSAPPPPNRQSLPSLRDTLPRAVRPTPSPLASVATRAAPAHLAAPAAPALPPASVSPPMKSVGSGPVFTGDLQEFCLPDLLEFLRNSHRTGLLMCTTSTGVGTIQLSRGMIIGADSPNALDLREHFLTSSEFDPDRRRALATLPPEAFGDELVEGVLVSRDLAARDEIERARVARIYSAFREMIAWTDGRFSFDPGVAIVTNPALALSAQSILMHIYQEQDEQGR